MNLDLKELKEFAADLERQIEKGKQIVQNLVSPQVVSTGEIDRIAALAEAKKALTKGNVEQSDAWIRLAEAYRRSV